MHYLRCTRGIILAASFAVLPSLAVALEVPKWSTQDFTFLSTNVPAGTWNGYTSSYSSDASPVSTFNVTFKAPAGSGIADQVVSGFYDGLDTAGHAIYRARFTPTVYAAGDWTYSVSANVTDITTVAAQQPTTFTVNATPTSANDHGFLRVDGANNKKGFVWDDGSHMFMWGQTYYDIMQTAMVNDNWKTAIDQLKTYGMNKVRLNVYTFNFDVNGGTAKKPERDHGYRDAQPYEGSYSQPNRNKLKIAYWQKLDEVVKYLDEQGMVADLILTQPYDQNRMYGTDAQNDRYINYATARYAAYTNVMYCVANEWDRSATEGGMLTQTKEDYDRMGALVYANDPWMSQAEGERALSIHRSGGNPDYGFRTSPWPTHMILQYGAWNSSHYVNGDEFGNYGMYANRNTPMPVVNDEYGYIGHTLGDPSYSGSITMTRTVLRNAAWGIAVGGGYGTIGDWRVLTDTISGRKWTPSVTGEWADAPDSEYDDVKRMVDFFTTKGVEYWKMASHNELRSGDSRTYVLAEPNRQYIAYAAVGGTFSVNLGAGSYFAYLYDPQTGVTTSLGMRSGGSQTFTTTSGRDWVVHLSTFEHAPEPGTLLLVGISAAGFCAYGWRRRRLDALQGWETRCNRGGREIGPNNRSKIGISS